MTADHTPERLSAAEREALMDALSAPSHKREWFVIDAAQDILAAHLADYKARLAAVEAEVTGAGCMCRGAHYVCVKHRVTAALHPGQGSPR